MRSRRPQQEPARKGCSIKRLHKQSFMTRLMPQAPLIKLSGVPSSGFTKMMSLGSRRGASTERKTTGVSRMSGSTYTPTTLEEQKIFGTELPSIRRIFYPERASARQYVEMFVT